MDKILLEGIRLDIRVGTTAEERSRPQLCGLDLTLEADLRSAGSSGDLNQTVDYVAVFRTIEALCTGNTFSLLEEVGHQICEEVLANYPVEKVKLKLCKLSPFTSKLASTGVELKRSRKPKKKDH
jgi:dihydroneopterin aldolase